VIGAHGRAGIERFIDKWSPDRSVAR